MPSFCTKLRGDIPMGTPLTGASNAGGVGSNLEINDYLALFTSGIGRPSAIDALLCMQCEIDQARFRAIHSQG